MKHAIRLFILCLMLSLPTASFALAHTPQGETTLTPSHNEFSNDITFILPSGDTIKMIYLEQGSFTMGATPEQVGADSDESPAHNVTLSSYYIAEFEVTQKLWQAVMHTTIQQQSAKGLYNTELYGVNPSCPMYYIDYSECEEFISKLNNLLKDKLPQGFHFSLPTEAQWEYAARGGKKAKNTLYAGSNHISEVAWYDENSNSSTHPVGSKLPNELGIYDMNGNVWEWCADWYSSSYYSSSPADNPVNLSPGSTRALRGASWAHEASDCRVTNRYDNEPEDRYYNCGMRVALVQ